MVEVSPPTLTSVSRVILLLIHPPFLILSQWESQVSGTLPTAAAEAKKISLERDAAEKERDKVKILLQQDWLKGFSPVLPLTANCKSAEEHCSLT